MNRACPDPPWAVRVENRAPLTVMLVVRGWGWVVPNEGDDVHLRTGDLAIARGPAPRTCADAPRTPPQALILAACGRENQGLQRRDDQEVRHAVQDDLLTGFVAHDLRHEQRGERAPPGRRRRATAAGAARPGAGR